MTSLDLRIMSLCWSKVASGYCRGRQIFLAAGRQHHILCTMRTTVVSASSVSFQTQHLSFSTTVPTSDSTSEDSTQGMAELRKTRIGKIQDMSAQGVTPYAYSYEVTASAAQLKQSHQALGNGCEDTNTVVSLAGRVMMRRFFGKLAFFELQDQSGSIQLYIEKKTLGGEFKKLKDWTDSGDFIGVTGTLKRTEKGELSVFVSSWSMLTKALHPLPDKFHGLTDIKKRYAHRSEDMIVNPEVRKTLLLRSVIIKSTRRYFICSVLNALYHTI